MKLLGTNCVSQCIGGNIVEPFGKEHVIYCIGKNMS